MKCKGKEIPISGVKDDFSKCNTKKITVTPCGCQSFLIFRLLLNKRVHGLVMKAAFGTASLHILDQSNVESNIFSLFQHDNQSKPMSTFQLSCFVIGLQQKILFTHVSETVYSCVGTVLERCCACVPGFK